MSTYIQDYEQVFSIRGKDIQVIAPARFDSGTNEMVYDQTLDDQAIEQAQAIYREQNGFLSPKEMKEFRNKIGIGGRDFATLMGWSQTTVVLYENGALPTENNNRQLKEVFHNSEALRQYYEASKHSFSAKVKLKIENYLNGVSNTIVVPFDKSKNIYSQALEVASWFIAENIKEEAIDDETYPMTQMKLQKLLYYAQRNYMQQHHSFLFSENTLAYTHGAYYISIGNEFRGKKFIFENGELPSKEVQRKYFDKQRTINENENVRNILMQVWEEYGKYEASYLRKINHQVGGAWHKNYREDMTNIVIPNEDILAEKI